MSDNFDANESIETVIQRYKATVYGVALNYTHNQADADDVFQETFLIYYQSAPVFNDEEHRKAWIIRTAMNCALRVVSSTYRKRVDVTDDMESVESVATGAFQFEIKEENDVWNAMQAIPDKYRNVLYLFYFEDLSVDTIAKVLNINVSTVKVRLMRGREILGNKLKEEGYGA